MNTYQKVNRLLSCNKVKLRKGRGYQYFTYDDGTNFDTTSIYWNSICDKDIKYLVQEGVAFAERCRGYEINDDEVNA